MSRKKALQNRRADLIKQANEILDAVTVEARDITPDEQTKLDGIKASIGRVDGLISTEDTILEAERTQAAAPDQPQRPGRVTNQEDAWKRDPAKGFSTPSEFFGMVVAAHNNGRVDDPRLKFLATAGSDEHGAYADPYGGFLVPAAFSPNMLSLQAESDPTAGRTTAVPMAAPVVEIPARTDKDHSTSVSGGLRVYRRAETQTVTASRMAVELVKLSATELMGLTYATDKILRESAVSLVALIEAGFRDEFGAKILDEKLNGTGAGQMEGILNSPATIQVSKEAGQEAATIVYENLINMRARCWGYQNAVWLYNHDALPQLMSLVMPIGTGGVPLWQVSAREGEPDMILGRPAFPTEFCQTLGTAGDLLLCNWSQYLEGTRRGVEMAESMHVRFEYAESAFRFMMENDGRCWWRSALTPRKSSATLSPFVKLQTRS